MISTEYSFFADIGKFPGQEQYGIDNTDFW